MEILEHMTYPGTDIAYVLAKILKRINVYTASRLADEGVTDLAPTHGAIFVTLYNDGPQSMVALSEKIGCSKSTITTLIRKLETLGYVRREPDRADKRSSIVHLTEKGFRCRVIFGRIALELVDKFWGNKSPKDIKKIDGELLYILHMLEWCGCFAPEWLRPRKYRPYNHQSRFRPTSASELFRPHFWCRRCIGPAFCNCRFPVSGLCGWLS